MKLVLYVLGFIWALPLSIIGAVLSLVYGPKAVRWQNGVLLVQVRWLIGFKDTIGQTFGIYIFLKPPINEDVTSLDRIIAHERTHTFQGFRWGIFFIFAYPLASLIAWARGKHFYRDNYFEIKARAAEK